MRKAAVVFAVVFTAVAFASPAYAYAHDRVANPLLHNVLDLLTLAVVTSPLWSAYLWGGGRRGLLALIAVVQLPAAVFAFTPIPDPVLHLAALVLGLGLTGASLWYVRSRARAVAASEQTG